MKRFSGSNSMAALIPTVTDACKDEKSPSNDQIYSREFQAMLDNLDEEACSEETNIVVEKKRRLGWNQVKSLEKHFEVENRLEPERKLKIAEEIGLQPRQVAIWFQNRRARWKTKRLEKDYDLLKSNYDALKMEHDNLEKARAALNDEIKGLKEQLGEVNGMKKKAILFETDANISEQSKISPGLLSAESESNNLSQEICSQNHNGSPQNSDTREVPMKENSQQHQHHLWITPASTTSSSSLGLNCNLPSTLNWFQLSDLRAVASHEFGRMENHQSFYGAEESCNIFSVDQAPTLHWYNFDQTQN